MEGEREEERECEKEGQRDGGREMEETDKQNLLFIYIDLLCVAFMLRMQRIYVKTELAFCVYFFPANDPGNAGYPSQYIYMNNCYDVIVS